MHGGKPLIICQLGNFLYKFVRKKYRHIFYQLCMNSWLWVQASIKLFTPLFSATHLHPIRRAVYSLGGQDVKGEHSGSQTLLTFSCSCYWKKVFSYTVNFLFGFYSYNERCMKSEILIPRRIVFTWQFMLRVQPYESMSVRIPLPGNSSGFGVSRLVANMWFCGSLKQFYQIKFCHLERNNRRNDS